jgi:ribosomal protein L14
MLQMESEIPIADNTGARMAEMIGVLGKKNTRFAYVGDIITAHVREAPRIRSVATTAPSFASTRTRSSSSTRTTTPRAPASSALSPVNCATRTS